MEQTIYGYIRFDNEEQLKKITDGKLTFSCAKNWIDEENMGGSTFRGDSLEAVFARVRKNDERIKKCKDDFGEDLEIIDDGEFVYLRRKSSELVPILCLYGIKEENFTAKEIDEHTVDFEFEFPDDMYKHFSGDQKSSALFIQANPFKKAIQDVLSKRGIKYHMKFVKYIDKKNDEFYIEPTDSRCELFYKTRGDTYDWQQEVRIILSSILMNSESKREEIAFEKMNDKDIVPFDVRVKMHVIGKR